jgi:hypothetical protein
MRDALEIIERRAPDLEVEGEMHADAALSKPLLNRILPDARLTAEANLLIMPNLDAANATFNALKIVAGQGISVGPILLGAGTHPDAHGHGPGDRQHDRADSGGRRISPAGQQLEPFGGRTRNGNRDSNDGRPGIPS